MYFSNFPKIYYNFPFLDGIVLKPVTDVTMNVRPIRNILENVVYYEDYDMDDGETPEIIAERIYGDPNLHWVLMLVNERYNYLEDWPIPEYKFEEYVARKYGAENFDAVHKLYGRDHYVDFNGRVVDSDEPLALPVSNIDYERAINQKKRRIRVVHPSMISKFVADLQEAFASE